MLLNKRIMAQEKIDWRVVVTGMFCITLLEIYALFQGLNGVLLTGVIALLATVIGVMIPNPFKSR